MELAGLSVLKATVVIEPVGDGAVLLGLQDQGVRLDGMHRPRIDLDEVSLPDRHLPDQLLPSPLGHHVVQLVLRLRVVSDYEGGVFLAVHDVPALRLAQAAVLVLLGISVVGMHLDAQVVLGIDDLRQQRVPVIGQVPEKLRMLRPHLRQGLSLIAALADHPVPLRVSRDSPAFAQVIALHGIAELLPQLLPSPDIMCAHRFQKEELFSFIFHFANRLLPLFLSKIGQKRNSIYAPT